MTYGNPRQYLVLRSIRDSLVIGFCHVGWNDRVQREVEDELVREGWLAQHTPAPGFRSFELTGAGHAAIAAYESNPVWSGVTEEKRWIDGCSELRVELVAKAEAP